MSEIRERVKQDIFDLLIDTFPHIQRYTDIEVRLLIGKVLDIENLAVVDRDKKLPDAYDLEDWVKEITE